VVDEDAAMGMATGRGGRGNTAKRKAAARKAAAIVKKRSFDIVAVRRKPDTTYCRLLEARGLA
jgi:hypothetical protein